MLDDPRVVAGGEPRGAGPAREREQLGEAKAAVAARARVRRLAARVAADERLDDGAAEALPQVERDVREAERVAGLARGDHRLGRAAGPLRVRPVRVGPEPERDADRVAARRAGARPRSRRRRSSPPRRGRARARRGRRARARSRARRPRASRRRPPRPRAGSGPAGRASSPSASASTIRSPSTRSRTSAQHRRARSLR